MGHPSNTLPDLLDEGASTSTSTTALASPDDLLSQLAGEEIDRLLSENETARAEGVAGSDGSDGAADAAGAAVETLPLPQVDLEELESLKTQPASSVRATPSPPVTPSPAPLAIAALSPADAPAPQSSPAPAPITAPPPVQPPDVEPEAVVATAAAERTALHEITEASRPNHERPVAPEAPEGPLPLYLRPLEWLSAPLEACPERVREALGKVAIVTLVNSIAVLIYVLVFRAR